MEIAELTKIYRAELASHIWAVDEGGMLTRLFTNGHILIAARVLCFRGDEKPLPAKWATSVPNVVGLVHTLLDQHGKPLTRERLVKFTGGTSWRPVECEDCEGTGATLHRCATCSHEHDCRCPHCKDGLVLPAPSRGRIDATDGSGQYRAFDRNYVGLLLEVLPHVPQYTYAVDDFFFALACGREQQMIFAALSRSAAEPSDNEPRLRVMEAVAS